MRPEPRRGIGCAILIYGLAAPTYIIRGAFTLLRLWRLRRISGAGYVDCPHCGKENPLDILASCPHCKTSEYGNRLRCTGCGRSGTGFPCEACGVTIHCL